MEARAVDIHLDAQDPEQLRVGDALMRMFIDHATELGVDHVIWNRRIWYAGRAGEGIRDWPAGRDPHTDHVHVAFTRDGSRQQPPYPVPLLDGIHIELYGHMGSERPTPVGAP